MGKILYNPVKKLRADAVKELMDTWYTLSNILISTAYKGHLKKEFCGLLKKMM